MKKQQFYINIRLNENVKDYPKVSGYVEEIEDTKGNKIKIGYHKSLSGYGWCGTELSTGLSCGLIKCDTKSECIENVHKNLNKIFEALERTLKATDWVEKYVVPFKRYVQLKNFLAK